MELLNFPQSMITINRSANDERSHTNYDKLRFIIATAVAVAPTIWPYVIYIIAHDNIYRHFFSLDIWHTHTRSLQIGRKETIPNGFGKAVASALSHKILWNLYFCTNINKIGQFSAKFVLFNSSNNRRKSSKYSIFRNICAFELDNCLALWWFSFCHCSLKIAKN